jgi:ParB family chromosome partitioning protein
MNKKQTNRLGRGIASIFNKKDNTIIDNDSIIKNIEINSIQANPYQPRKGIANKELKELIESIKSYGLIQPITVRKKGDSKYELISGERRLRASKIAGLILIPAFIKSVRNNQMLEMALVENIQREDLDPIEISLSLQQLIKTHNVTQDYIGKKIGKNRSTISNYLRLLKLHPIIQAGIRDKMITMGHARALINIIDKEKQFSLYQDVIKYKYSVRETELITRNNKQESHIKQKKINNRLSVDFQKLEDQLSVFFNKKIKLKVFKNGNGKIEVPFNSEKKLDEIIKLLQS